MPSFGIQSGRVIRIEERGRQELSRTAIVASIGKPEHYPKRILDIDGTEIDGAGSSDFDYSFLVRRFFESGVDVIRLNLSHLDIKELRTHFPVIKDQMLKCEGGGEGRKRMALLADLPGPKIRFHLKPDTRFTVNQHFTIHFTERTATDKSATVYVGEKHALKEALELLDKELDSPNIDEGYENKEGRQLYENTLGGTVRDFSSSSFENLLNAIDNAANSNAGLRVVIGDGEVQLKALKHGLDRKEASLECVVVSVHSEKFKPKVGFTLRGVNINIPSFTQEDREIVKALLELDYSGSGSKPAEPVVTFIAVSFAQTSYDISQAKKFIEDRLRPFLKDDEKNEVAQRVPSIIAKIETVKGYENRKYILDVADGIMVARGDLGLQMDIEKVPAAQKRLIRLCNERGKPVITATQLLKSMTTALEPTRAESSDVFNAVNDGSDAVMMSEETSTGRHPFQAINKMISIGVEAERYHEYRGIKDVNLRRRQVLARIEGFLRDNLEGMRKNEDRFESILALLERESAKLRTRVDEHSQQRLAFLGWLKEMYLDKWNKTMNQLNTDLITEAACKMSAREGIRCIIAASTTGRTVRMISRLRPGVIIVGAAHDPINTRKVILSYGTLPICIPLVSEEWGPEEVFLECEHVIRNDPFLSQHLLTKDPAVPVVFTAGMPLRRPGTTNLIQVRDLRRVHQRKISAATPVNVW